jgi:hypothetical protein
MREVVNLIVWILIAIAVIAICYICAPCSKRTYPIASIDKVACNESWCRIYTDRGKFCVYTPVAPLSGNPAEYVVNDKNACASPDQVCTRGECFIVTKEVNCKEL